MHTFTDRDSDEYTQRNTLPVSLFAVSETSEERETGRVF
jgi:hypothetical protein